MKVFKEHDWKRWKFNSVKPRFWSEKENQVLQVERKG